VEFNPLGIYENFTVSSVMLTYGFGFTVESKLNCQRSDINLTRIYVLEV